MLRFQLPCPGCGEFMWFTGESAGQQTNCPECHQVFVPQAPPPLAELDGAPLRLVVDPQMSATPYGVLAPVGVTTQSPMAVIRKIETSTDEIIEAWDVLKKIRTRLAIDLLLYPIWHAKEADDGPG